MAPLRDLSNTAPSKTKGEKDSKKKKVKKARDVITAEHRILDRLARAVATTPLTMNRSPELIPLTAEWEATKKKLRLLIVLAKDYAETTEAMRTSRSRLVSQITHLSEKSPFYESLGGNTLDDDSTQALQSIRDEPQSGKNATISKVLKSSNGLSVEALQQILDTQGVLQARGYEDQIVAYTVDWEKVVTEKVEDELKKVRALQATRSHYEKKIDKLRQTANDAEKKGKQIPSAQVEKLERNEAKLKEAFEAHESEAGRLCVLIEEVTTNGWKDLYHFVKYYCKWESFRVDQESEIYSRLLPATLDSMKATLKNSSIASKKVEEGAEKTAMIDRKSVV